MRLRNDRREDRVKEGAERNVAWQALSSSDKLLALTRRPGESKRQVLKLTKVSS